MKKPLHYRDFDLYRWQQFPISEAFDQQNDKNLSRQLTPNFMGRAVQSMACVLTFRMVYDSSFIIYGYPWEGVEYVFAFDTGHDAAHRVYSKDETPEFYDSLKENSNFKIILNPENPAEHFITEPGLEPMNQKVIYFDPAAESTSVRPSHR